MRFLLFCRSELGLPWSLEGACLPKLSAFCSFYCAWGISPGSACPSEGVRTRAACPCHPLLTCHKVGCDELHKHSAWNQCRREGVGAGGVPGKLLHIYSFVLNWCFLVFCIRGKFDKTYLVLNLTGVFCFFRSQERENLSLVWSLLGLNCKYGMWVEHMMNPPAGKGGTKRWNLAGLHLVLWLSN